MKHKKLTIFGAENSLNGEQAKELASKAEQQFFENDFDASELKEALGEDDGFVEMAYKNDDGEWAITGRSKTWPSYEAMTADLGYEP